MEKELRKEELRLNQEVRLVTKKGHEHIGKICELTLQKIKIVSFYCSYEFKWEDVKVYKAEPDIYYCSIDGCKNKADYFYEKDGKDVYVCEQHMNEDGIDENCLYILEQTELKLTERKTNRGFSMVEFKDRYGAECSLQESSLATETAVWFGISDPNPQIMASKTPQGGNGWVPFEIPKDVLITTQMHLTQLQIKQLLPVLKHFADTGEVNGNPKKP